MSQCDKSRKQVYFIFTILNTYVPLIQLAKIQPKIFGRSGGEVDYVIFAIFSNGNEKFTDGRTLRGIT